MSLLFAKSLKRLAGVVYQIRSPFDDKIIYVGKADSFAVRMVQHLSSPHNVELHKELRRIIKAGLWPEFEVIEICPMFTLLDRETYWIRHRATEYKLYNVYGLPPRKKDIVRSIEEQEYIKDADKHWLEIKADLHRDIRTFYKIEGGHKYRGRSGFIEWKARTAVAAYKEEYYALQDWERWISEV